MAGSAAPDSEDMGGVDWLILTDKRAGSAASVLLFTLLCMAWSALQLGNGNIKHF
jgi:hypothetical protein